MSDIEYEAFMRDARKLLAAAVAVQKAEEQAAPLLGMVFGKKSVNDAVTKANEHLRDAFVLLFDALWGEADDHLITNEYEDLFHDLGGTQ